MFGSFGLLCSRAKKNRSFIGQRKRQRFQLQFAALVFRATGTAPRRFQRRPPDPPLRVGQVFDIFSKIRQPVCFGDRKRKAGSSSRASSPSVSLNWRALPCRVPALPPESSRIQRQQPPVPEVRRHREQIPDADRRKLVEQLTPCCRIRQEFARRVDKHDAAGEPQIDHFLVGVDDIILIRLAPPAVRPRGPQRAERSGFGRFPIAQNEDGRQ